MHRLHRCIAGPIFSTSTATSVRDVGPDPPNRQRPRLRRIKMPITKSEYELSSPVPGFIEVIHPGVLVCVLVGVLASVAEIRHPHRKCQVHGRSVTGTSNGYSSTRECFVPPTGSCHSVGFPEENGGVKGRRVHPDDESAASRSRDGGRNRGPSVLG